MENSASNSKKHTRRRVADSISKSPAPSAQQSPATKLLAALNKAQGKSVQNLPHSSKQSQKCRIDPSSSKQKSEYVKKGGLHSQAMKIPTTHCGESTSSGNVRTSGFQASAKEGGPSSSNSRRNHPTAAYSLWSSSPTKTSQSAPRIPHEVLQDLTFRFLANIPEEEKSDKVRMCFQVELAHWFYIDFYCKQEEKKGCIQMGMREFARQIFKHCDELAPYAARVDQVIDEWRWYKSTVPTYGAILLDESLNYVLLVQGFYASKNSWGFPKGKVNEGEEPRSCAVREVFEETGFNFDEHRPRGCEKKIQKFVNETMVRLYIVPDVPTDFPFAPQTRNEIRKIQWFNVWDLPTDRSDQFYRSRRPSNNNFYTVVPFVQDLQKYIVREQERRAINGQKPSGSKIIPSCFGDLYSKTVSNIHSTDISAMMDVLFSASGFAGYEGNNSMKSVVTSFPETVYPVTSNVPIFNATPNGTQSTYLSMSASRFTATENLGSTRSSHFRPLAHSPLSKNNLDAFAESASAAQPSSIEKGVQHIAHPIAIPAQPVLPLINRPVYVAPKDKSSRISLSETSAFTAFKSPSQSSFIDTTSGAVDKIELELQKLLCTPSDGEYFTGIPSTSEEMTPSGFLDSLRLLFNRLPYALLSSLYFLTFSPDTDLGSELAYMNAFPKEGYASPSTQTGGLSVKLCDAWKEFKLDRVAIFEGLPDFETKTSC
ncbi:Dcp2, box A domain protein [Dictyocaulus viviparus]|uniref:mRNA-decapping enzyme 2 n=1 Tax=Dictyocaulus viviparus TaxID=29172 RepID=A0A0D8Y669_DICVI|nr:Dcp2, box A domain protein [Dictyocaulus viviparus]